MTATTSENKIGLKGHTLVIIIYALLIAAFYSPVIFGGKSLIPSLYQPHGVTSRGVYGEKGRTPVNTFNVDLATPAFNEFPVNKLVGDMYREHHIPLWNPYQGGGTPLAAQYSTRVFFPYQIIENISPVSSWDYFILGRLLIAGFFTYLFMVALGAGPWGAFAGGLFYMFSGVFTWFGNLEQLANVAMTLPLLLLSVELLARARLRARWVKVKIVFTAFCFALILLAGQPETALYVLTLALLYYLFRSLTAFGPVRGLMRLPRLAIAFVMGLALSSPLLLLFVELFNKSAHIHQTGGAVGIQRLANWRDLFSVITPTLTYFPANKMGDNFFNFLPTNGLWDTLGGYTGILPIFLIVSGVFISPLRKKIPLRKELFFFIFIAAFILLKNAGIWPFILLGKLPLFDMVWSLHWAGPVWVFAIAVAAGLGLGMIEGHLGISAEESSSDKKSSVIPRGLVFILTAVLLGGVYIIYSFAPSINLFIHSGKLFNDALRPFVFPSIISGSLVTLIVIGAAFAVTYFWKNEKNIYALLILAILELWWVIPRGYAPETLTMKWVPLGVGLLAVSFLYRNKVTYTFMALIIFFGAAFFMDGLAPNGYPPRDNPFRSATYVSAILKDSGTERPRVAGAYGALMPNYAGVVRLDDIRYVNSLVPEEMSNFRRKYLYARPGEELKEYSLWFSGLPERAENPPEDDFISQERAYSMLGVRYFIFPAHDNYAGADEVTLNTFKEKFPLMYRGGDARVYKNPEALPRVFLATKTIKAASWEEAQKTFMEGDFDPAETIVVEETSDDGVSSGTGSLQSAVGSLYQYVSGGGSALSPASAEAASEPASSTKTEVSSGSSVLIPAKAVPETITWESTPIKAPKTPLEASPEVKPDSGSEAVTDNATKKVPETAVPESIVETPPVEAPKGLSKQSAPEVAPEVMPDKIPEPLTEPTAETAPEKAVKDVSDKSAPSPTATEVTPADKAPEDDIGVLPEVVTDRAPEASLDEPAPPTEIPFEAGARIREYSAGKVVVEVKAERESVLVLGDIYYPGWKVKVNDERAKIIRVNGLIRGVSVKEGRSRVVFYYMPLKFMIGLGIMGLALLFSLFLIFRDIRGD